VEAVAEPTRGEIVTSGPRRTAPDQSWPTSKLRAWLRERNEAFDERALHMDLVELAQDVFEEERAVAEYQQQLTARCPGRDRRCARLTSARWPRAPPTLMLAVLWQVRAGASTVIVSQGAGVRGSLSVLDAAHEGEEQARRELMAAAEAAREAARAPPLVVVTGDVVGQDGVPLDDMVVVAGSVVTAAAGAPPRDAPVVGGIAALSNMARVSVDHSL